MDIEKRIGGEKYREITQGAIVNCGSSFRIKQALSKGIVTAAFVGGSVTYGYNPDGMAVKPNFAEQVCSYMEKSACAKKCICKNYGLSGTASLMGSILTEKYIRRTAPDIIFVEYAVNESKSPDGIAMFEGLIRKLLKLESNPAVVIINILNSELYSCDDFMRLIGLHYDLPVISCAAVLAPLFRSGGAKWSDYSSDAVHPVADGHKFIADCVCRYIDYAVKSEDNIPYKIPQKPFSDEYEDLKFCDFSDRSLFDSKLGLKDSGVEYFEKVLKKEKSDGAVVFETELECRDLILVPILDNNAEWGCAEIYADGEKASSLQEYTFFGWNNPNVKTVFKSKEIAKHHFVIRAAAGDERRILAFGGFAWC